MFTLGRNTIKQKRGTAICTKFAPPYNIFFIAELEEKKRKWSEYKPYFWWRLIDNMFFLWEDSDNKLKSFIAKINNVHFTINFTAESSKISINFLNFTASLIEGVKETDLHIKPTVIFIVKKVHHIIRLNRICSAINSCDQRCNNLVRLLLERSYSSKLVRIKIRYTGKILQQSGN